MRASAFCLPINAQSSSRRPQPLRLSQQRFKARSNKRGWGNPSPHNGEGLHRDPLEGVHANYPTAKKDCIGPPKEEPSPPLSRKGHPSTKCLG